MALIHLIYVSTARREYGVEELDKILESSARHNAPQHVTGMLLYAGGSFLQVLEGEETAVDETMSRIENDPRHTDIYLIEREPIDKRSFAQWSMGFRRLGAAEAASHPAYAPFFEHGFQEADLGARPGLALTMLKNFGRHMR